MMNKTKSLLCQLIVASLFFQLSAFAQQNTISANKNPNAKYAGLVGRVWDPINNPATGTYIIITNKAISKLIADGISYGTKAEFRISFLPPDEDLHIFAFSDNIPFAIYHSVIKLANKEVYKLNITLPMPPLVGSPGYITMNKNGDGFGVTPASLTGFVLRMMTLLEAAKEAKTAELTLDRLKWLLDDRYDWKEKSINTPDQTSYPIPAEVEEELKEFYVAYREKTKTQPSQVPQKQQIKEPPLREVQYQYLIEIVGGGGINTETILKFSMDNIPVRIEGRGSSDATDGERIAISKDGRNYLDFQGDYWADLTTYASRQFYVKLNSKWGLDNDSYMELIITFTKETGISYLEMDNNSDDLEYVKINQVN